MITFFSWITAIAMWALLGVGIMYKATLPWVYNLAHFLFGFTNVVYCLFMFVMWLGFTFMSKETTQQIIDTSTREKARKMRRLGVFRMTISVIISLALLVVIVGQGWFVLATFQLIGMIFFWLSVPMINKHTDQVKEHFGV